MTSEIYFESGPGGNNASLQSTTVGGSKPLHRFIKGEPKIIGIVVLVLGVSFIIISAALQADTIGHISSIFPPGNLLGTLYILCGILYILTEHNPTKKKVTMSLALSIVTILGAFWIILTRLPYIVHSHFYRHYEYLEGNSTETEEAAWVSDYEVILMMSTTPTETPAEL
ncbi:membrane-spanning 4-domains subfamily A member 15-like isoform X2 [Scomber scombrus]|uniref:membrane-spanning 4-domains subfamily A member 15-like isoform X2 n=1 Tax=Scomber scombrus TaxID=13677 RepID=UPI002DDA2523|nr:membrane-spanning 4-domains subfamily A member 15-like isoform X2 [Scomber scombrus]